MAGKYAVKIAYLFVIFVLVFVAVRYLERRNLYFPLRDIEFTPTDAGLAFEDVSVTTRDGVRISGWFIPAETPRATVLLCHGNGGNISHRLEKIKILNSLGLSVFIFDYRGYGNSEGSPSEQGLYADAEAGYYYLTKTRSISASDIIVYGESLGGAVATNLAATLNVGAIILEGTFTSVRDMAKRIFPFIPTFIYKTRYDSLKKINKTRAPKLILHSEDDEIVPFRFGKALFDAAQDPKYLGVLQGSHNDAFLVAGEIFRSRINDFVAELSEHPRSYEMAE